MSEDAMMVLPRERPLSVKEVQATIVRIQEILTAVMKKDTHYGTIPGTPKPTLYKPGAELILATFNISAMPEIVEDLSSEDEIRYRVTVKAVARGTGVTLGSAVGECSSSEEKYKWRRPVCDEEYNETAIDRRREVWKVYKGKPYKTKQIRTNPSDVANTILQMATKRAIVPVTRLVTACSDVFEQDLEDLPEELRDVMLGTVAEEPKPAVQPPQRKEKDAPHQPPAEPPPQEPTMKNPDAPSSGEQQKAIHALARKAGISDSDLYIEINSYVRESLSEDQREEYRPVGSTKELTMGQASVVIKALNAKLVKQ